MKPIIAGDSDNLPEAIETTARLMSQATQLLTAISDTLSEISDDTFEMYNAELHRHNYHKHNGEKGHGYEFGLATKGNGGKSYLYGCRGYKPLCDLLIREMNRATDEDMNGLRYFHDFCFGYDDPDLPPVIRKAMESFHMPGKPKHFTINDEGNWKTEYHPEPVYWNDEYNVIHVGYDIENPEYPPKFVQRNRTVVVYTWQQYLDTLPRQLYAQYSALMV